MSGTPTPKQALILWCLLGRHGSALQSALVPEVKKADREALLAGHYVAATKEGRSLRLTVTDRGWNWAGEHMREPLPPNFRVFQDWLERIGADLAANGRTLAELVGPPPEAPALAAPPAGAKKPATEKGANGAKKPATEKGAKKPATARAAKGAKKPATARAAKKPVTENVAKGAATPKEPTPEQLRARIEKAYLTLTNGERAKAVRLSALRAELTEFDRATVDAGLAAILSGDATARLSQFSDPKSLTPAEREAAFSPAGEPFHILRIQS